MLILKSKNFLVGTRRKRKSGWWLKDRPKHWQLLRQHVTRQYRSAGVHPNHPHAKAMYSAASRLIRHFANSRTGFSEDMASVVLDNHFGHLKDSMRRYGLWKNHTISAVKKYLKEMGAVYGEGAARNASEISKHIAEWQEKVSAAALENKSQVEMDDFVARQFASHKKKIAHLIFAARQFVGVDTPLSQTPDTGFKGFCKAIITKFYEHGPAGVSQEQLKVWEKAFETVFKNARDHQVNRLIPLAKSLTQAEREPYWREHPKWFVYCCTRLAIKNDGLVDLAAVSSYMKNSMKYHGSKNPPSPTYDQTEETILSQIRLGMLRPSKAKVQKERMYPTKIESIRTLYLKKKRMKKSLVWSGKGDSGDSSDYGAPRSASMSVTKDEGKSKMRRRWRRLLERRPDLKEKYGEKS
jgi:hypothetical protein